MANRERTVRREIKLTAEEWQMIESKMAQLGTKNFSAYARKMLVDGYIVKRDFSEMKKLISELGAIGRNINQIARRANETRNIYQSDVSDLQRDYKELKAKVNERLVKIIHE